MRPIKNFNSLEGVVTELRYHFTREGNKQKDVILLFAHNGTGKTRLSMEFKEMGKTANPPRDTLYFNAFTEDLFSWDNDLENDTDRTLKLNSESVFFDGLQELEMESKIRPLLHNYVDFDFLIDYENYKVFFSRSVIENEAETTVSNIKISRGEENLFIWCFFIAICEIAIDQVNSDEDTGAYNWVKYIYIDDPISSLDENNAIAVACDLGRLIKKDRDSNSIKTVVSTHHSLFFNVMFNELNRDVKFKTCYLHVKVPEGYTLQDTGDTPFFHHIAIISQLEKVVTTNEIYTYHFNTLRSILEKTASFFGYDKIDKCIDGLEDEVLFERVLNLFSHGKYSVFDPREMGEDNKDLFKRIFRGFIDKYKFDLPEIFSEETEVTPE